MKATPGSVTQKYTLEKTLGEGSFALVRLAHDNETKEKVAVKIIQRNRIAGKKEIYLYREVNILAKFNTDSIVRLHAFYEERDTFNLVMEFMEGGPLFDRILSKRGGYSEKEARDSVENIVKAIYHCHEHNIIHRYCSAYLVELFMCYSRDLKPENLLLPSVNDDLHIKLADFGLSIEDNNGNIKGTAGSPLYMAPEIISKLLYG